MYWVESLMPHHGAPRHNSQRGYGMFALVITGLVHMNPSNRDGSTCFQRLKRNLCSSLV